MTWHPVRAINDPAQASGLGGEAVADSRRFPILGLRHNPTPPSFLRPLARQAVAAWKWLEQKRTSQVTSRRLKVAETVSLGEKRFVSILTVDDVNFLVGGAAGSVSLLAILDKQDKQPDAALPRIQIRSNQIIPSTELSA